MFSKFARIQPCISCIKGSYVRISSKEAQISVNSGTSDRMDPKRNENRRMADSMSVLAQKRPEYQ